MSDIPAIDPLNDPNASIVHPSHREAKAAKRRKGAPNGNKNALRHGFYARELGVVSPAKLDEYELRNLMGEVSMLKDYMHILYTKNLDSSDPIVLTETLRALSLAGMAVSRLLLVHCQVRISRSGSNTYLKDLFADMDAAASRANRLSSSISHSMDEEDD